MVRQQIMQKDYEKAPPLLSLKQVLRAATKGRMRTPAGKTPRTGMEPPRPCCSCALMLVCCCDQQLLAFKPSLACRLVGEVQCAADDLNLVLAQVATQALLSTVDVNKSLQLATPAQ
jgi:hypothetical protein